MSNRSIKESINKITKISSKLDSNLSNLNFSKTAKFDEKNSKINLDENLASSNNSLYLKENFESNFEKYMINDNNLDNSNHLNATKKIDVLDLSASSLIRQSGIDKKAPNNINKKLDSNMNKYNHLSLNERRDSVSSNSVISSQSSKKSQKFEKNMERIKNISNNLYNDNNLLKNLFEKIDDNLNSDKIGNSLNNLINTSQKTSTFAVLEKQITNENKINIQNEKINIQKEEEKNEDLNKSVYTHCSKYKNQTQQYNKSLAVNVLMNNLKSNNASIYHSFGDLNQLVPTIKITNNQEINEEITELIENNTIELVETLKSSNTINKDETNKKNIMNIVEKLDKIIITKRNVSLKIFYNKIKSTTIILRSKEKNFYIKNFLNKIRYIRDINFKKNIRKERRDINQELKKNDLKKKIFREMLRVCMNQKQWVNKIRYEFFKNYLW